MRPVPRATVERAIRFIRERIELHRMELAREIGEHLFTNIYGGSIAEVRSMRPDKEDCIERIAADGRVRHSAHQLRACVHFYLLERQHARQAPPPPELTVWQWHEMWELEGDPESLVRIATWTVRYGIPQDLLAVATRLLGPYLRAGGRIEDLMLGDEGETVDTPFDRFGRMCGIARGWLAKGPRLSGAARAEALTILADIEKLL